MNKITNFLNQRISHVAVVSLLFFVTIPAVIFGFWYGYKSLIEISLQIDSLSKNIATLDTKLASTTTALEEGIHLSQITLEEKLSLEKQNTDSKLSDVQNAVGSITGTVTDLEKLSKTDPELLQKYSKVFFLNEHYAPSRVVEIPKQYQYYEDETLQVYDKTYPYLQNMISAAKSGGIELYVYSAYRSFDTQEALKGTYTVTYGAGTANTFSADQGYSEHQLGTTIDLITTGIGGTLDGFDKTNAYQWLLNNAHKYGYTLSYPENNSFYVFEPWHWRFVGVKLATYLHNNNKHFYDLDQRTIDDYLINLFD